MEKKECNFNKTCAMCRWSDYCTDDIRTKKDIHLKNNCMWFFCKNYNSSVKK